jgi:two-component system phosphate regulon response regulator PhoB
MLDRSYPLPPPQKGTTMTAAPLALDLPRLDRRGSIHVLVVDDEPDIRQLVALALRGAGYAVTTAGSGVAAIAAVERRLPDAMVLDVMMPGMSGFDVCRALRSSMRTEALPIVMLTARNHVMSETEGLLAGADLYLVKPFSPRRLVAEVENLLSYTC